jgi:hypothetical protein
MAARNLTTVICILTSLSDPEGTIVRVGTLFTPITPHTQALIPVLHERCRPVYVRNILVVTFVTRMHHKL